MFFASIQVVCVSIVVICVESYQGTLFIDFWFFVFYVVGLPLLFNSDMNLFSAVLLGLVNLF